jgi:hypothetical protein
MSVKEGDRTLADVMLYYPLSCDGERSGWHATGVDCVQVRTLNLHRPGPLLFIEGQHIRVMLACLHSHVGRIFLSRTDYAESTFPRRTLGR